MKKGNILLLGLVMIGVIIIGQFQTSASEIDVTDDKTTTEQSVSEGTESGYSTEEEITEGTTEEREGKKDIKEEQETGAGEEDRTEDSLDEDTNHTEDQDGIADNTEDETEAQEIEETESDSLYYQGLRYYCSRYQYECEIVYLKKYLEYIQLEVAAGKEMYDLGEMTAADFKSYQALQTSIQAQITVAENQRDYNTLFIEENDLDYHDYIIKEKKSVKNIDDYLEQYPEKNHMTMAGYVTNYRNALAYIDAKEMELDSLTMKLDAAKLLYEAGESSKLELKQQEAAVAKAQYELEQYYVEMNLAYINLILYCR